MSIPLAALTIEYLRAIRISFIVRFNSLKIAASILYIVLYQNIVLQFTAKMFLERSLQGVSLPREMPIALFTSTGRDATNRPIETDWLL